MVDRGVKRLERHVGQRLVEDPSRHRQPVCPERPAAADQVLPEPRLRFVNPQRDCLAHRRAIMGFLQTLLVKPVADLVEDAEKGVAELVLVEPRRDAAVARPDPRAERVGRHVQPAAPEVEAHRRGHRLAEDPLAIARITSPEDRRAARSCGRTRILAISRPARCGLGDRRHQRRQLAPQGIEQDGQLGTPGPRLVLVEQGIVDRSHSPGFVLGRVVTGQAGGFLPLELDDLLQPGPEPREVARGPRRDPLRLSHRGRPRQLLDQRPRQSHSSVIAPPQLADVHRFRRDGVADQARSLDGRQQLADPRVGRSLVVQAGQQRHLTAAMGGTTGRHVRLLVPAQYRRARGQRRQFPRPADQLVVCLLRIGGHGNSLSSHLPSFEIKKAGEVMITLLPSSSKPRGAAKDPPPSRRTLSEWESSGWRVAA